MKSAAPKAPEHRLTRKGKVRKEFWLDPKTLRRAQKIWAPPLNGKPSK